MGVIHRAGPITQLTQNYGALDIKMWILVIVGERWTCVMSMFGTRGQLRYVIVFERIAIEDRFGSMLCSACVSGFSVLFGDASVNKRFLDNVGDGFEVDGTVQVV